MEIAVTWFNDQFNIELSSKPGAEPFLQVKGCRIVDGSKGAFVSYPATKNQNTGKYWNHAWGSDAFNSAVLKEAEDARPRQPAKQSGGGGRSDDGEIPFASFGRSLAE